MFSVAQTPYPIRNLSGSCLNGILNLTWDKPYEGNITLQYSKDPDKQVATSAILTAACRWEASDLTDLGVESGMVITSVSLSLNSTNLYNPSELFIKIWQGGTWPDGPKEELYSQIVNISSLLPYVWNEIKLDLPVVVDATQMLWIGHREVTDNWHSGVSYNVNFGPIARNTYSNCVTDGNATQWGAEQTFDWCIRANVTDSKGSKINLGIHYDVYQDGEKIGETELTSFEKNEAESTHVYCVVAVYDNSIQSIQECVEISCNNNVKESDTNENTLLYFDSTTGKLLITNEELQIKDIEIFDILGKKQKTENRKTIDINHLQSGVYLIKITTVKGVVTKKIIKY